MSAMEKIMVYELLVPNDRDITAVAKYLNKIGCAYDRRSDRVTARDLRMLQAAIDIIDCFYAGKPQQGASRLEKKLALSARIVNVDRWSIPVNLFDFSYDAVDEILPRDSSFWPAEEDILRIAASYLEHVWPVWRTHAQKSVDEARTDRDRKEALEYLQTFDGSIFADRRNCVQAIHTASASIFDGSALGIRCDVTPEKMKSWANSG